MPTPFGTGMPPSRADDAWALPMDERMPPPVLVVPLQEHMPELAHELDAAALAVAHADAGAPAQLLRLFERATTHADPRALGVAVFARALAMRAAPELAARFAAQLRRHEGPQAHVLELQRRALPFADMATRACTAALGAAIAGRARPAVVLVGSGTGRLVARLLCALVHDAAQPLPMGLTAIGVEPAAWSLAESSRHAEQAAQALGVEVSFYGVCAAPEALGARDWRRIRQACAEPPVVQAAFALHRMPPAPDGPGGRDPRDGLLRQMRAIDPGLLVLAETDADHAEPDFLRRFRNAWAHYGALFAALDARPLRQADRDALKVGPLGREIADVVGMPDTLRTLRHERGQRWLQRLQAAGFDVAPAARPPGLPPGPQGRGATIVAGAVPVATVLLARPAPAPGRSVARGRASGELEPH